MAVRSTDSREKTQHARFLETARALGCDESEEAFDEKLKMVAQHKPKGTQDAQATASSPRSDKPR